MNFDESPEFKRDVKRLKKKWQSIPTDIDRAKLVVAKLYQPTENVDISEFREQFFATRRATVLLADDEHEVVKMRLDCAALGNDKKTRLVFLLVKTKDTIRLVELFAKNEQDREDRKRLKRYL